MKTIILFASVLIGLCQTALAQGAVWRDVPAGELGGVAVDDLAGRMRASMAYATKYGFGAGVPTFHNSEKNGEIVYGTVLLPKDVADFKDIPATELGNANINDFPERVRQAMIWATNHGYAAGIPTFNHADYGRGIVYGVMLVKADKVKFVDVYKSKVRRFDYKNTAEWARVATDAATSRGFAGAFPSFLIGKGGTPDEVFGAFFFQK